MTREEALETLESMPVAELEFSVRVGNALRQHKIENCRGLLALTQSEALRWDNFGVKSWREVAEMQSYLRGELRPPVVLPVRDHLRELVTELNRVLAENPKFKVATHRGTGDLVVYEVIS